MKTTKMFVWVLVIGLILSAHLPAFAQEEMQGMSESSQQEQGGMMGGGQGKGKKMMGMMHKDSLVATSDGGVVVLSGPRLIKFDKDLNVVKEVEMPRGKKPGQEMQNQSANASGNSAAPEGN